MSVRSPHRAARERRMHRMLLRCTRWPCIQVTFYRTDPQAKAIVQKIPSLYDLTGHILPQDLAFFRGDQCWFASVAHEQMAFLLHATKEDITLMTEIGAIKPGDVEPMTDDDLTYYAQFDEKLVRPKNNR